MFKASAYKLNMFLTCPQKYKFTYIDDLAKDYATPKPYLTMGAHVHNALKDFYQTLPPTERTFPQLESILRKRWRENRQGFVDKPEEAKWGVKALQMLRLFVHRLDVAVTPVLLEDYYDADINPQLKVIGRIDRADRLPDGSLHVIDYKTGKYDADTISDLQLLLYALIVSHEKKQTVTKASYLYLQTWQWYTLEVTPEKIDHAIAEIADGVALIQQEQDFTPTPNAFCRQCDFLPICPAKPQIEVLLANAAP